MYSQYYLQLSKYSILPQKFGIVVHTPGNAVSLPQSNVCCTAQVYFTVKTLKPSGLYIGAL